MLSFDLISDITVGRRTITHIFLNRKEDLKGETIYPNLTHLFMHQDLEDWEKATHCATFPLI